MTREQFDMALARRDYHQTLIAYLLTKVEQRDWHGVSDAANDLRVLEAQMEQDTAQ